MAASGDQPVSVGNLMAAIGIDPGEDRDFESRPVSVDNLLSVAGVPVAGGEFGKRPICVDNLLAAMPAIAGGYEASGTADGRYSESHITWLKPVLSTETAKYEVSGTNLIFVDSGTYEVTVEASVELYAWTVTNARASVVFDAANISGGSFQIQGTENTVCTAGPVTGGGGDGTDSAHGTKTAVLTVSAGNALRIYLQVDGGTGAAQTNASCEVSFTIKRI